MRIERIVAPRGSESGFTLLEMMIILAIVLLLASMGGSAYDSLAKRTKIKIAQDEMQNFVNMIVALRSASETPVLFHDMTGNSWTDQGFTPNRPMAQQKSAVKVNNQSWSKLFGYAQAPLDPWGSPYTFDENEMNFGDPNFCVYDAIVSAGPDRILDGWKNKKSDDLYVIIPHAICSWGPDPVTDGVYW